jgi:hypothetical protein
VRSRCCGAGSDLDDTQTARGCDEKWRQGRGKRKTEERRQRDRGIKYKERKGRMEVREVKEKREREWGSVEREFGVRSQELGVGVGVWSLEFGVWSLEFGVWSLEFGLWSLEVVASRGVSRLGLLHPPSL